jgi:NADPH:quinone reductase-like Zn-dependent oxidoreductase
MLAAIFRAHGGPETIELAEVATPTPGRGDVRVAVRAAALNHLDLFVRRGIPSLELPLPHVGGSDVSGVVDEVGADVSGWASGDEVVVNPGLPCRRCNSCRSGDTPLCADYRILGEHVHGGFAEFVVIPADRLYPKPPHLTFVEAASVPLAFQTAWRALITRAAIRPGEDVLVLGASGGVAVAAVQIAKLAGARVIAVTSSPQRCERVQALGADVTIDRTNEPWSKAAWLATGRRGAHVVVENVGQATWHDSLRAAARGGRIVTYGATTGAKAETDLRYVFWKHLSILGTTMANDAEFAEVMHLIEQGQLQPVVGAVMDLDDAPKAHEMLEGGEVFGKLVLQVRPNGTAS